MLLGKRCNWKKKIEIMLYFDIQKVSLNVLTDNDISQKTLSLLIDFSKGHHLFIGKGNSVETVNRIMDNNINQLITINLFCH